MKKNTIIITLDVEGEAMSGKSTVLYIIKEALKEKGFDVVFHGGLDFINENRFDHHMSKDLDKKIKAIKSKCEIKLKEKQMKRTNAP